ncbi:MAG: hypothetical protein K2L94_03160 [Alphaproteobacteria bacterium]|nr:hypothetical protein [Alphaproteobacteria bacterium]
MANLHFHYGTMGSSKSAQLLINAYNQNKNGNKTEILKPQTDTRFSTDHVDSRIGGLSAPATALANLNQYWPATDTKMILIDEIQFFAPSDIDRLVRIADTTPVIVMCYGLMVDSNEQMFPASRRLIEVGAKLHRMESTCQMPGCMRLATHHLRFDATGDVIRAGKQICVGDSAFKSVCRQHFNAIYHNINTHTK